MRGERRRDLLGETLDYEELLAAEEPGFEWPDLDERAAAAMCYTSGTTGNPKGVVYSHRSTWLHSIASTSANALGYSERDRILLIVPMFHANGWGAPYTAFLAGSELVMPQHLLQGVPLLKIIADTRPTLRARRADDLERPAARARSRTRRTSPRFAGMLAGGSAVPPSLIEGFRDRFGVHDHPGLGDDRDEPPRDRRDSACGRPRDDDVLYYLVKAGRVVAGVEMRICDDDGNELAKDGEAVGEIEVRGPWITGAYYASDDPEKFHDGWLRTGDVGSLDRLGFLTVSDRTKDVIKSGGEWISSVDLENQVMAHPGVFEAAVVAIPDERWSERPLVCVVATPRRADALARRAGRLPPAARRQVVAAGPLGVHRRGAEDLRRQVRQEGASRPVREGRARRRDPRPSRRVSVDEGLAELAAEIDALAERLADRSLELLRTAVREGPTTEAARREKLVTRARRSLEKAATLLRGLDDER